MRGSVCFLEVEVEVVQLCVCLVGACVFIIITGSVLRLITTAHSDGS